MALPNLLQCNKKPSGSTPSLWTRLPELAHAGKASGGVAAGSRLSASVGRTVDMGEAGQGPASAAFCNAVASAVGVRLRDLPLTAARIRSKIVV